MCKSDGYAPSLYLYYRVQINATASSSQAMQLMPQRLQARPCRGNARVGAPMPVLGVIRRLVFAAENHQHLCPAARDCRRSTEAPSGNSSETGWGERRRGRTPRRLWGEDTSAAMRASVLQPWSLRAIARASQTDLRDYGYRWHYCPEESWGICEDKFSCEAQLLLHVLLGALRSAA